MLVLTALTGCVTEQAMYQELQSTRVQVYEQWQQLQTGVNLVLGLGLAPA